MGSYSQYKKIVPDSISDDVISKDKVAVGAGSHRGIQWIFNERAMQCHQCSGAGGCVEQANGKCCLWTVPDRVTRVTFEIWSGGGGGAGGQCCNYCQYTSGGNGGNYAIKTINVTAGDEYTVCAGGSWPCSKSHTCAANMGCRSFVIGNGLSNFCANGGCGGLLCADSWGARYIQPCANCGICGIFGADFGIMGSVGFHPGNGGCHCIRNTAFAGTAPFIGRIEANATTEAWCSCGFYTNWPAGGGMSGVSSYCGNWAKCCSAGSGQGGSGIVKISYF